MYSHFESFGVLRGPVLGLCPHLVSSPKQTKTVSNNRQQNANSTSFSFPRRLFFQRRISKFLFQLLLYPSHSLQVRHIHTELLKNRIHLTLQYLAKQRHRCPTFTSFLSHPWARERRQRFPLFQICLASAFPSVAQFFCSVSLFAPEQGSRRSASTRCCTGAQLRPK